MVRFAVGWENFASEWFIGAINRDARKWITRENRRLETLFLEAARAEGREGAAQHCQPPTLQLSRHPKLEEIRAVIDPAGANITFPTFGELVRRSQRELISTYSGRVTLLEAGDARGPPPTA
jgi:hypothetical protein